MNENEKLSIFLFVRVSPKFIKQLKTKAKKKEVEFSSFVRLALFNELHR